MGGRKGLDGKVPDPLHLIPVASHQINGNGSRAPVSDELMEGPPSCVHRDLQVACEGVRSPDMIDVLMGDEDSGYPLLMPSHQLEAG